MVRKKTSSVEKRPTQPPLRPTDPAESTLLALLCFYISLVEQTRLNRHFRGIKIRGPTSIKQSVEKICCRKKISIWFPCEGTMTNKPSLFGCGPNRRHRFVPNRGRLCLHRNSIPRRRMSLGTHCTACCVRTIPEEKSPGSNCSRSSHFLRSQIGKSEKSSQIETWQSHFGVGSRESLDKI